MLWLEPQLRVSRLPDMLEAAHRLGLRRRHRVQRPLLACAIALVSSGVACRICAAYLPSSTTTTRNLLLRGQALSTMTAVPCFLMSLQPGDAHAVRAALVVYAVMSASLGGLNANTFAGMHLQAQVTGCGWAEVLSQTWVLLNAFVDVVAALAATRAAASPLTTRARIKQLWYIAGIAACAYALIRLLTIATNSAAGVYVNDMARLAGSLALGCVYGLNAVFALSGRLRASVQNCIEARGGAIERAAIVSALIGGRSVKSALALARTSFRAIRMDALCAADLASNDATSSARLHALSTPVQYGEVDVRALQSRRRARSRRAPREPSWRATHKRVR